MTARKAGAADANPFAEIMTESMRFFTQRLQQDLETQQALLACTTPADLMRVQADFFGKAVEDYGTEAARMAELVTKAAGQPMAMVQTGQKRDYDDVPL
ncbi:MAG: phasin family protein [Proteobacteria bacterium]|nr:phasin family protein [Pseudomonadota bacterium]